MEVEMKIRGLMMDPVTNMSYCAAGVGSNTGPGDRATRGVKRRYTWLVRIAGAGNNHTG